MILQSLSDQGIVAIERSQTRKNLCLLLRQPYTSFGSIESEPIAVGELLPVVRRITEARQRILAITRTKTCKNLCRLLREYLGFSSIESEAIAVGDLLPDLPPNPRGPCIMILQTLREDGILAITRTKTCKNLCRLLRRPYSSFGSIESEPIAGGDVLPIFRRIAEVHAS